MIREAVEKAVENYNRYRSPEAAARILEVRGDSVLVEFSGSFCYTCGVYDWLEDLIYELREVSPSISARIRSWKRVSDDRMLVEFELAY